MASADRPALARLVPIVLGLMAAAAFATGILLQMQVNARHAALAEVYLAGPPAPVAMDRFAPDRDTTSLGEARLTAVLDLDGARLLSPLSEGGASALAVPLRARAETPAGGGLALFVMADPSRITPEMLRSAAGQDASSMPLLTLNGAIRPAGAWEGPLAAAGLGDLTEAGPVIFPFVEGRRAAILPRDYGQSTHVRTFSWIGGLFGALALLAFAASGQRARRAAGPADAPPAEAAVSAETPAPRATPAAPDPILVVTSAAEDEDPAPAAVRRSPVRAILLGLALAFIGTATLLALPGASQTLGFASTDLSGAGLGTWAGDRWEAAKSGDLRAILVLVLATGAVIAVTLKVSVQTLRRPAAPA